MKRLSTGLRQQNVSRLMATTTATHRHSRRNFQCQASFTDAHVSAFHRDGIVCIPKFIPDEVCDSLRAKLTEYVEEEQRINKGKPGAVFSAEGGDQTTEDYFLTSGDKIRFFLEKGQTEVSINTLNKVAHALHTDGSAFQEFCSHPAFKGIARKLGRAQPNVVQSMYILKPPGVGTAVGPHQDSTWIHTTPFSCLGLWFALEDTTVQNSCLHAVLGSHHTHVPLSANSRLEVGADGKTRSVLKGDLPNIEGAPLTPLECPKGSIVVFGGETIHCSSDNLSDKSRHAFVFHLVDDQCRWTKDNWFGEHLARLAL